jgi:hypothetical protein
MPPHSLYCCKVTQVHALRAACVDEDFRRYADASIQASRIEPVSHATTSRGKKGLQVSLPQVAALDRSHRRTDRAFVCVGERLEL